MEPYNKMREKSSQQMELENIRVLLILSDKIDLKPNLLRNDKYYFLLMRATMHGRIVQFHTQVHTV